MFIGLYYPRDPQTEFCALMADKISDTRFLGGTWIGSGNLTGRDTRLSGELRVTSSETLAFRILTAEIARFRLSHPGITVELTIDNRVFDRLHADSLLCPVF